ncbi:DUF2797 domain-containing protein [Alicyclobacillus vulcanalis]|uniref:DUF2797 domain-containing protein n=1 Tax=Alicyclobacillus vulcanalis TaxID=252246 RepID=A0A1N7KKE9_9BACL|nr:DUF2797 domain-containing protein [Alicyclobacillus vulcanalis]SIS62037.1 Protein of unknown function [Alicyclobacillus vulcanalis]
MLWTGDLRELEPGLDTPVSYRLRYATAEGPCSVPVSIGDTLFFRPTGERRCIACGRRVKKLYQNGYCFPCVQTLAECDLCIVKPHECHFHLGTCRDDDFARVHCMVPHYVYIAWSSGFKVGITRKGRELRRWMDQGASEAAVIAEVPDRKTAGEIEVHIARGMADKTNWRKMLADESGPDRPLLEVVQEVQAAMDDAYRGYLVSDVKVQRFTYPRQAEFALRLTALGLGSDEPIGGVVRAIKGQYLVFDSGVLNVKRWAGHEVVADHVSASCSPAARAN